MLTGIAGIATMGVDKLLAVMGWDRISERTLHIIALLGGFWGIIFGAFLFRHKTTKREFWPPVLFAAALWVGLFFAVLFGYIRLPATVMPLGSIGVNLVWSHRFQSSTKDEACCDSLISGSSLNLSQVGQMQQLLVREGDAYVADCNQCLSGLAFMNSLAE